MKKTYKVKNYKGQLVESLERFAKKYKGMRVVEASEKDGALNIVAEEDDDYENGGINPDDYTSYATAFEAEVRKIVTDPEKVKNILTATDELASRDHVRSMLLDKFLKDDHDGFIQGFADLFGMSPDEHNEEDVKTAWNELVKAQPRAAIMYQLQGVGPEILDDVLEAAGFETGEPLEEAEKENINEDKEEDFNNTMYWKPFKWVELGDIARITYLGNEDCVVIKKTDVKGVGGKGKIRDQNPNEEVSDDEPVIVCQSFTDGKIYNYIYNQGISVPNTRANIKNITAI